MNYRKIIIISTLFLICFSCAKKNSKKEDVAKVINEWVGKKIRFPDNIPCYVAGRDTATELCKELFQREYKLLLYVDSTDCSSCRLKLTEWKQLIAEADTLFKGRLEFLLFFQPKSVKDVNYLFREYNFQYPVFIDVENKIGQLNHFPAQPQFQCFLLDKDNKVLKLGNPVLNPKIWELYKERITGQKSAKNEPQTVVKPDKIVHNYGIIKKGSKNNAVFKITNTGSNPLIITRVTASCGCTNVDWDKRSIKSGETAAISAETTPDETGALNKTIDVFGNFAESPIKLTLMGQVE